MVAPILADLAGGFIEHLPDILRAAATNILSLIALLALVLAILAYFFFKDARDKIKLVVWCVLAVCVLVFGIQVVRESNNHEGESGGETNAYPCTVAGFVYNEDAQPLAGMPNVNLAYIPHAPPDAEPVPIATTGPKGDFSFICSHVRQDEFPIILQMTYAWSGRKQIVQSEDRIFFTGNNNMNLYLSAHAITNWNRTNRSALMISSHKLTRGAATAMAANQALLPTNGILTVPKSYRVNTNIYRRPNLVQPKRINPSP